MSQAPTPHGQEAMTTYVAPDLIYLGTLAELTQEIICPPDVDPTGKEVGAADGCSFLGTDIGS
jgi:hypothetical protein